MNYFLGNTAPILGKGEVKTLLGNSAEELGLTPFILVPNGDLFSESLTRL